MKGCIKAIFISMLSLVFTNSCVAQFGGKPKHFTLVHENKNTNIDDYIKINGFYYIENTNPYTNGSSEARVIFYANGIVCFPPFYPTKEENKGDFKRLSTDKSIWGSYIFDKEKQLIHTEAVVNLGLYTGTTIVKKTFKILDLSHIQLIKYQTDDRKVLKKNTTYEFKEEPNRMDSTNWLLKKKWFWEKGAKRESKYL